MSELTDTISKREGKIKLYIPQENLDQEMSTNDRKDMNHRLDAVLINWNRQIKELINVQVNQNDSDNAGPIDEINQWKQRRDNLMNVKEQLENPELKQILDFLRNSNSSYMDDFTEISEDIDKCAFEAEDNLQYLSNLREPCLEMAKVNPLDIPKILPTLLHCVRMIWEKSLFYNTEERIAGLLRKI